MKHVALVFALVAVFALLPTVAPAQPTQVRVTSTCGYDEQAGVLTAHFLFPGTGERIAWHIRCVGDQCSVIGLHLANIEAGRPLVADDFFDFSSLAKLVRHPGRAVVTLPPSISFIVDPRGVIVARGHKDGQVATRQAIKCQTQKL